MGSAICSQLCQTPVHAKDPKALVNFELDCSPTPSLGIPTAEETLNIVGDQSRKSMTHIKTKNQALSLKKSVSPEQTSPINKKDTVAPFPVLKHRGPSQLEINIKGIEGFGVYVDQEGNRYEGGWKSGVRHGYGEEMSPDGAKFIGNFSMNTRNGFGKQSWADGSVYEGNWSQGSKHGKGKHTYSDGCVYDGQWQSGQKDGFGIFTTPENESYAGEFKDGLPNGNGVYTNSKGEKLRGFWVKGVFEEDPDRPDNSNEITNSTLFTRLHKHSSTEK